jgi:hypothetical protein
MRGLEERRREEAGRQGARLNRKTAILSHDGEQPFPAPLLRKYERGSGETVFRMIT